MNILTIAGLPNLAVDAMFAGRMPMAANCPRRPREVLQGGKYGYLVPIRDPVSLADGILRALRHPLPVDPLKEAALPFSEDAVIARHFDLLGIPTSPRTNPVSMGSYATGG